MRFKIASHARAHGISKNRIIYAMANLTHTMTEPDGKLALFGIDSRDIELRMVAFQDRDEPDLWIVIHAMPAAWTHKGK